MSDYRDGTTELEFTEHKNKGCRHHDTYKSVRNGFYIYTCESPSCKKVFTREEYRDCLIKQIGELKNKLEEVKP